MTPPNFTTDRVRRRYSDIGTPIDFPVDGCTPAAHGEARPVGLQGCRLAPAHPGRGQGESESPYRHANSCPTVVDLAHGQRGRVHLAPALALVRRRPDESLQVIGKRGADVRAGILVR